MEKLNGGAVSDKEAEIFPGDGLLDAAVTEGEQRG